MMEGGKKCALSNCCLGEHQLQKHADNMKCIRDSLWRCHSSRLKVSHYVHKSRNFQTPLFNIVPSTGRKVLFPSSIAGKLLGGFLVLYQLLSPQHYTLYHRTNSQIKQLVIEHWKAVKGESYLRDFPHQVTSFRSLQWHHRSHESPIFITIFALTGLDPKKKLWMLQKKMPRHICCLKSRLENPPLFPVWRISGGPVALPVAVIECCLIKVRPVRLLWLLLSSDQPGPEALSVCVYGGSVCQLPNSGGSGSRNVCVRVCVFVPFCLCVCWDIKRLSEPLPWCPSIQEGLGGWRHLWSFGKRAEGWLLAEAGQK